MLFENFQQGLVRSIVNIVEDDKLRCAAEQAKNPVDLIRAPRKHHVILGASQLGLVNLYWAVQL
jgi:hypothetical protein